MPELPISEPIPPGALCMWSGKRVELQGHNVRTGNPVFLSEDSIIGKTQGIPFELARSELAALTDHNAFDRIGPFDREYRYGQYLREKFAWQTAFGPELEVPHPPQELVDTLRHLKGLGITCFDAHYIPPMELEFDSIMINGTRVPYPTGWRKPNNEYFILKQDIKREDSGCYGFGGGWVLAEATDSKDMAIGQEPYPNDQLIPFSAMRIFPAEGIT